MKRLYRHLFSFMIFFIFSGIASGQVVSCYEKYKKRGDIAKGNKLYDIAIKQYQAARLCDSVSLDKLQAIDNLIDLTYQIWVKDLKDARKLADDAAAASLVDLGGDYALKGDMNKAYSVVSSSQDKKNPVIINYLSEIAPFVADVSFNNIMATDSFSYQSRDYLVLVQKPEKEKKNSRKRNSTGNKAANESKENDNDVDEDSGVDSIKIIISDASDHILKELFAKTYPADNSNNDIVFKKTGDSLIISTRTKKYIYKFTSNSIDQFNADDNNDNSPDKYSPYSRIDTQQLKKELNNYGLSVDVSYSKPDEKSYDYMYQLMIREISTKKEIFAGDSIVSIKYLTNLNQVLIAYHSLADSSYNIKVLSIPSFALTDSFKNIVVLPTFNYINENYLLPMEVKNGMGIDRWDRSRANSEKSTKKIIYDLVTKHLSDNEDIINETFSGVANVTRIENGFLNFRYTEIFQYNQFLEKKRRYLPGRNGTHKHIPDLNKLLILKTAPTDYTSSYSAILIVPDKKTIETKKNLPTDTLTVFDLSTNDSTIYMGRKISILNDTIVSIASDSTIDILSFSKPITKRIAFFEHVSPIEIELFADNYDNYLTIKFKENYEKNDTTNIVFSIKTNKQVLKITKPVSGNFGFNFFCYTDNAGVQELYHVDTLSDKVNKININLPRANIPQGYIHYLPKKDIIYFIENYDDISEETEEMLYRNFFTGNKKTILKLLSQSTIKIFYLNSGKWKTIKSTEALEKKDPLNIVGNFIVMKGFGLIENDDDEYEKCHLFNITPESLTKTTDNQSRLKKKIKNNSTRR